MSENLSSIELCITLRLATNKNQRFRNLISTPEVIKRSERNLLLNYCGIRHFFFFIIIFFPSPRGLCSNLRKSIVTFTRKWIFHFLEGLYLHLPSCAIINEQYRGNYVNADFTWKFHLEKRWKYIYFRWRGA